MTLALPSTAKSSYRLGAVFASMGFWKINRKMKIALLILVPILLLTIFASWLPIPGPLQTNLRAMMQPPSFTHPFGTDRMGRSVLRCPCWWVSAWR
jgi:ABC-type dipeptide/oligopeptide/nickel transport system permease subunit